MPQRYSGVKELRKNQKRHLRNLDIKSELKKTTKDFLKSVTAKSKTEAKDKLKLLFKKLDKASKRKILAKNTASRRKSRFSKLVNQLAA